MKIEDLAIPKDNIEFVAMYRHYVANQVSHLNRRPENTHDILQSVWVRLIEADVVGKFHAREAKSRPEALTTEEVCLHLGIEVGSWMACQTRYQMGDRRIPWMPTPIAGQPDSLDALWCTGDVERYEVSAHQHHEKVAESECLIPKATPAKFRTYLQWAVHNAYANWCRTHSRRNKERAIDLFIRVRSEEPYEGSLFDVVGDCSAPTRHMEACVESKRTVERLNLGGHQDDFCALLSDGYTALEAARKLNLTRLQVARIQRILSV